MYTFLFFSLAIQEDLKDDVIDDTTDVTSVTHDTEADVIDDDSSGDVCVTTSVNRGFRPLSELSDSDSGSDSDSESDISLFDKIIIIMKHQS